MPRSSSLRAGAVLALLALAAYGCGSAKNSSSPSPLGTSTTSTTAAPGVQRSGQLVWKPCTGSLSGQGVQCATLQVPLDYSNPSGPTIGIALDRVPASGKPIGSLLVNPGGPGGSGLDFLPAIAPQLSPQLRAHFDIVGFDPRGVGASEPVVCGTGAELDRYLSVDEDPATQAGVNALIAADRAFAAGCKAHTGPVLAHVGTVDAARDMDRIRQALGDAKLNYLGFSYGTFLGATYAEEFPTHVRAMVLDGAEDPSLNAVTTVDTQAAAVDAELNAFFDWCAGQPGTASGGAPSAPCAWKPAGGRAAMQGDVLSLISTSKRKPLRAQNTSRTVGPNQVLYGVAAALYEPQSWPGLGQALAEAARGNGTGLLGLYDSYVERNPNGTYGNLMEANSAISCEDQPWPSISQIEADAAAARRMAPVFGEANLYSGLLCDVWPYPPSDHPHPIKAQGSPPILVVGSTGDPATPYSWAQALASQLSHGVLLTRTGEGHTAYLSSQCVRNAVDAYMVDLHTPAPGTNCPTDSPG